MPEGFIVASLRVYANNRSRRPSATAPRRIGAIEPVASVPRLAFSVASGARADTRPPQSAGLGLRAVRVAVLLGLCALGAPGQAAGGSGAPPAAGSLLAPTVQPRPAPAAALRHDAVVEAVRHASLATPVSGAVIRLDVRAGDRVAAGQLLLQLDTRAATQTAAAGAAQAQAARAALDVAGQELQRQRQLRDAGFISAAAFERAEAEFRAARAQAQAALAQAGAARAVAALHELRAPFSGVVSEVAVVQGDMALPARPLVSLYDPSVLRISAAVPASVAAALSGRADAQAELALPGAARAMVPLPALELLPAADPATHTRTVRALLPAVPGLVPGSFARLHVPAASAASSAAVGAASAGGSWWLPESALVRRGDLSAVYVLAADGRVLLRQVRTGRSEPGQVEIIAGLRGSEAVIGQAARATPRAAGR